MILSPLQGQEASNKEEIRKLQGKWQFVLLEDNGKNSLKGAVTVVFKDDKAIYQEPDYRVEATFRVDGKKTPKHLDLTLPPDPKDKNDKGLKIQAIYQLDGDRLKICYRVPPAEDKKTTVTERPTAFDSKKGGTLKICAS